MLATGHREGHFGEIVNGMDTPTHEDVSPETISFISPTYWLYGELTASIPDPTVEDTPKGFLVHVALDNLSKFSQHQYTDEEKDDLLDELRDALDYFQWHDIIVKEGERH